ncbi:MAG TPA: 16S rRNA (cytidine(1402)-2'-O)-methyltransferase, partial [Burkholderiaceae bacterium]|nr:16S rRNA (cytidine(1402)-2'-O)-methyltransferase [Burkholderiaceae bacterium]
ASRHLLDAWEVSTPLLAAHRHNEAQAAAQIIERLQQGQRVALISDAGTPGVSDPGGRIVREVRQAGYQVMPIPGPSAPIAALMVSGATSDENPAFVFAGFLPPKQQARQKWLGQWKSIAAPVLMFETPHRLKASVADLLKVYGAERTISVARELTKRFEEFATLAIAELPAWLNENPHRSQGEFVLVLHEAKQETVETDALLQTLLPELLSQLSVRDAVRIVTKVSGLPRSRVYQAALQHEASKK